MLNSTMGYLWKNNVMPRFAVVLVVLFTGCSTFIVPTYPDIIYIEKNDAVSVKYYFRSIEINFSIRPEYDIPTAYNIKVFSSYDQFNHVIEKVLFPDEEITLVLPRETFSIHEKNNRVMISPHGGDYEIKEIMFDIPSSGKIDLGEIEIRKRPVIIEGYLVTRSESLPIADGNIRLVDSVGVFYEISSNINGNFTFELPDRVLKSRYWVMTVDTQSRFPIWSEKIHLENKKYHQKNIVLGHSAEFVSKGMLYLVTHNLTALREGPENGSPIQLFLSKGDQFLVTAVAGDRVKGIIEIFHKDFAEEIEGWVRLAHLELVQ